MLFVHTRAGYCTDVRKSIIYAHYKGAEASTKSLQRVRKCVDRFMRVMSEKIYHESRPHISEFEMRKSHYA